MASNAISDNNNNNPNQQQESTIPVLTVFKKRSIIKNIFIILNNNNNNDDDDDDNDDDNHTLLVGRHPNNNIVLTHPSISRFHLQIIRFSPSSRSISILDSSSVHGTWVNGKKIEHGVSVDLKEGDTFQLGVSSRFYLLHFVSKFDSDPSKKIGSVCYDNELMDQFPDETFEVHNEPFETETSCSDGENDLGGYEICFLSPPYVQSVDKVYVDLLSDGEKEDSWGEEYESENDVAAGNVTPTKHELGCTFEEKNRRDDVFTSMARLFVSDGGNCNSRNSTPFSSPFSTAKYVVGVTARASNFGRHSSDKQSEPSVCISEKQKRSWDMVVDTSSLLNKESRKALQLLQGLKGTRLIIPQSVIQALVSMKQESEIFRRISEASLALEWIEECIGNTKWWIHILDHALQYKRDDDVGHIVLLSEDVTLKIKSMANGLLCETVQQFRQSLVNPFSERFMWANSSPRGLTWSCRDDVILREKYCCLPPKAGLKLLVT